MIVLGGSDRDRDPGRIESLRVGLPENFPILWPQCAGAIERLFDYHFTDRGHDRLTERAREVLACVGRELHDRRSRPLDRSVAIELVFARKDSLEVLIDTVGRKAAKEAQIELAVNQRPLSVCVGTWLRRPVATAYGDYWNSYTGCFCVFEDVTRTSSVMWPWWCPDCRQRNGRRNPMRDQDRAFRGRIEEWGRSWDEWEESNRRLGPH